MNTLAAKALMGAAIACTMIPAAAHAADPITGRWVTQDKDAIVSIGKCGSKTCGRIAKFLVPPPDGPGQRDINNPSPAKRKRTLLGLAVLSGFTEEADLWRGQIYDPKTGKSYRSVLRRKGPNVLEVKGCISIFCQTQIWRRAK
ncbi:MAG: DUF2147 domain-containing protein [Pseudomonadota bacterium]